MALTTCGRKTETLSNIQKKKNKRGDMTGPKLTKLGDVKSINIVNKKEDNFIYNLRIFRLS